MNLVTWTILLCWVFFSLYWVARAFSQKAVGTKTNFLDRLTHKLFLAIAFALLIFSARHQFLDVLFVRGSIGVDFISVAFCLIGLAISIWARRTLADNWDQSPVIKKKQELIMKGPYKLVRHPIYSGVLLMFLGTALAIGMLGGFVSFIILFIGFWIKLKKEEAIMTKYFKEKYLNYKRRSKTLIPYIL